MKIEEDKLKLSSILFFFFTSKDLAENVLIPTRIKQLAKHLKMLFEAHPSQFLLSCILIQPLLFFFTSFLKFKKSSARLLPLSF